MPIVSAHFRSLLYCRDRRTEPRQARKQEMKWGVLFVRKWKMGVFCLKKVENGVFVKKVENGGCFFW